MDIKPSVDRRLRLPQDSSVQTECHQHPCWPVYEIDLIRVRVTGLGQP